MYFVLALMIAQIVRTGHLRDYASDVLQLVGFTLARHEGEYHRLELWRRTWTVLELRWQPVELGLATQDRPGAFLWRGDIVVTGGLSQMSCAISSSGSSAVVGIHEQFVQCWTSGLPLWRSSIAVKPVEEMTGFDSLSGHNLNPAWVSRTIRKAIFDDESATMREHADVEGMREAQAFEWHGSFHVAAHGTLTGPALKRMSWEPGRVVWVSEIPSAPIGNRRIAMKFPVQLVAKGAQPRVLTLGEEVMIALQQGRVREDLDCRLGFYRSRDLRTWTLDEALCGLRIGPRYGSPNYAVGVARGTLWVAAAARGEGDRTTIELFRFDEEGSEWVRVEAPSGQWGELPAEGGRLWLFPTSSRDPYPLELVFTDTEGRLQIRRP